MKAPGSLNKNPNQKLLRTLMRSAREARSRVVTDDHPLRLRDVYAICYELARDLRGAFSSSASFSHLQIMVGDLAGGQGLVQHHWIEIPLSGVRDRSLYVDAACDSLDPFQPVRVGTTADSDFMVTHRNGIDANIDVNDPRNRPDVLYKTKSACDPESL
jgi:hypothetical protein